MNQLSQFELGVLCGIGSTLSLIGVAALIFIACDRVARRIAKENP